MSRALEFEDFPRWKKEAVRSSGAALWENREALDKYLKRLAELMAAEGDETAATWLSENEPPKQSG
jgi:hypothetical protein